MTVFTTAHSGVHFTPVNYFEGSPSVETVNMVRIRQVHTVQSQYVHRLMPFIATRTAPLPASHRSSNRMRSVSWIVSQLTWICGSTRVMLWFGSTRTTPATPTTSLHWTSRCKWKCFWVWYKHDGGQEIQEVKASATLSMKGHVRLGNRYRRTILCPISSRFIMIWCKGSEKL